MLLVLQWFLPTDGGYLEPEGFEKTYRYQQQPIVQEVDLLSSRKPFDMILPGKDVHLF
jgi:U3 small nucleolar RNA-associated protein 7